MRELIRHILKEETEDIDQKVMNFLVRRYEVKEINIDDNIRLKRIHFKVDDDYYNIGTFDNKKMLLNQLIIFQMKTIHIDKKLLEQLKSFYPK